MLLGPDILRQSIVFGSRGKFRAKISAETLETRLKLLWFEHERARAGNTVFSRQIYVPGHMHTRLLLEETWALSIQQHSAKNSGTLKTAANVTKSLSKAPEKPKIVEFPKCESVIL